MGASGGAGGCDTSMMLISAMGIFSLVKPMVSLLRVSLSLPSIDWAVTFLMNIPSLLIVLGIMLDSGCCAESGNTEGGVVGGGGVDSVDDA